MSPPPPRPSRPPQHSPRPVRPGNRPPLRVQTTTLWEYPSQHYDASDGSTEQGSKDYAGATPSWVIWQCLERYTRENDTVLDPMVGSGTTLDVCHDLKRTGIGFDLNPQRDDIRLGDARSIDLPDRSCDFVFIDPPYSTHIEYSDDPRCIGKLDAADTPTPKKKNRNAHLNEYYQSMTQVIEETHRVLKNRRYMALYVSDSWKKRKGPKGSGNGLFMPIGFELFNLMQQHFEPVDIISVVRHNQKLGKSNWHKAAREENFFLRGFNYLFIMKKVDD